MMWTQFCLDRWLECVAALGVAERYRAEAIALYHQLDRAYGQPWRAYHNHDHIESCLALWVEFKSEFQYPAAVAIALWFHDAVYVPQRSDNEARSARWAGAVLRRWQVSEEVRSWLVSAILATQHQAQAPSNLSGSDCSDHDRALMLDIDLSILAAPVPEFTRYEAAIRHEYNFVSAEAFRVGRLAVLRSFLERDRLFGSAIGFTHWEARARQNLATAIEQLRSRVV